MAHDSSTKEFVDLIDNAVPLILHHSSLFFDETLSGWMGEEINSQYLVLELFLTSPNIFCIYIGVIIIDQCCYAF